MLKVTFFFFFFRGEGEEGEADSSWKLGINCDTIPFTLKIASAKTCM